MSHEDASLVPCVGAIVHDGEARLLLICRANPPGAGTWSLPGGRVKAGESDQDALVREVFEETRLHVTVGDLVGTVQRAGPAGAVFDIRDYRAAAVGGALLAGDDASDARWVTYDEMRGLPLAEGLLATLTRWDVLPAGSE